MDQRIEDFSVHYASTNDNDFGGKEKRNVEAELREVVSDQLPNFRAVRDISQCGKINV
jgi:hypothetical protein